MKCRWSELNDVIFSIKIQIMHASFFLQNMSSQQPVSSKIYMYISIYDFRADQFSNGDRIYTNQSPARHITCLIYLIFSTRYSQALTCRSQHLYCIHTIWTPFHNPHRIKPAFSIGRKFFHLKWYLWHYTKHFKRKGHKLCSQFPLKTVWLSAYIMEETKLIIWISLSINTLYYQGKKRSQNTKKWYGVKLQISVLNISQFRNLSLQLWSCIHAAKRTTTFYMSKS